MNLVRLFGITTGILAAFCLALIIALAIINEQYRHSQIEEAPSDDPSEEPVAQSYKDVRLSRDIIPEHYDISLFPQLETGLFYGNVTILLNIQQPTNEVKVNVKNLNITFTELTFESSKEALALARTSEDKKDEIFTVVSEAVLAPGNYSLAIRFQGDLTSGIVGFYRSVYKNRDGQDVHIATSKFQPTYARRAFPCIDEPTFKSTFTVTLIRPTNGYIALSNMPVARETPYASNLTAVEFVKSVPMVTYLVCFIVCDFEYEETFTEVHRTKFRVYAVPQQKEYVTYSLDVGANITDFFTDYFKIDYPLPKQDMIAIPDFVSGAMEHWGLITYRETNLLFNELESSSRNKQRVATVVSHELAHQWFGNLVTLEWWDDLWLNEGFASYMEYKGVANYHPDWKMEDQFISLDLHTVMDLDSTVNSHPIVQEVLHPDQITEIFDKISYSKGASVLRMLESFLGADKFRAGIHNFLNKYKYKNAVTKDLWRELENVVNGEVPVSDIMDTWTKQMGYPVLHVTRKDEETYEVRQERYLQDPSKLQDDSSGSESPYGYKWDVPVTWISSSEPKPTQQWFNRGDESLTIRVPPGSAWIKINVQQKGFYRVNYDSDTWDQLADLLLKDHTVFSPSDRSNLLNDAFSLATSGHVGYDVPLSIAQYLGKEKDMVPWETVYENFVTLIDLLRYSDAFSDLQLYLQSIVKPHYETISWTETQSHTNMLLHSTIIELACLTGDSDCTKKAGALFSEWINDPKGKYLHPDIRSIVYYFGMEEVGNHDMWQRMLDIYLNELNPQEKRKLMCSLGKTREPWILHKYLEIAKNESIVRGQDYFSTIACVNSNPVGNFIAWNYLRNEWPYMVERFTLNDRYLGRMPKAVAKHFTTQQQLEELKAFFSKYPKAGAGARSRRQAVEKVENNIKWFNTHKDVIKEWLANWRAKNNA